MRYIFSHDGTAINVDHIVTIFVHATGKPDGYVVRCSTTFAGREYVNQHAHLNLSPVLPDRDAAETWLKLALDKLNPR